MKGTIDRAHRIGPAIWPEPGAKFWMPCYEGGGPNCPNHVPPPELRCSEALDPDVRPCRLLGKHTIHNDGYGTRWWPDDEAEE